MVVPLAPEADWSAATAFSRSVAAAMAADCPERYTDRSERGAREGRLYVDTQRNARADPWAEFASVGQTLPRPGRRQRRSVTRSDGAGRSGT